MIFIKGENISLSVNEDTEAIVELLNNEVTTKGSQLRLPIFMPKSNDNNNLILEILFNAGGNNQVIGRVSLENINYVNQSAELKIFVDSKMNRRGYGKEACELIIKHGFEQLNLRRIECGTFATNEGMKKLALKLGFKEEGRRTQAVYKNGAFIDVIEYGLIKGDDEHAIDEGKVKKGY